MAVLMVNAALAVRRRDLDGKDSHGHRVTGALGTATAPLPGRVNQGQVHGTVRIGLDTALWPVQDKDVVVEPSSGRTWLVTSAELIRNAAAPDVDYIRVEAREQDAAAAESWPAGT